jgi:hypothetical protein
LDEAISKKSAQEELYSLAGSRLGLDKLGKSRQDDSVDGVGLGELAQASSKVAHLTRIGDDGGETGFEEIEGYGPFVSAGGFQDDQRDRVRFEGLDKVPASLWGIGDGEGKPCGCGGDCERILCDVYTDEKRLGHGNLPILQMRARRACGATPAQAAVRVGPTGATRITLGDGLEGRCTIDLSPPTRGRASFPPGSPAPG